MEARQQHAERAREIWLQLIDLVMTRRDRFAAALSTLELNPPQAHLLRSLAPGDGQPMCRLAEHLACDASNVTNLVDRLESRGLIERRATPNDRRVKHIVLTDAGARVREQVLADAFAPPPELLALSPEELVVFAGVLSRLVEAGPMQSASAGNP